MTVISKYPVFEADQVLSQSHLNSIVSYFETQDRATRKGLIGIGVVCGLDISFPAPTKIKIGCGTAITSLGFQINWEEKTFSKYKFVDKLSDSFISPVLTQEPFLTSIFQFSSQYSNSIFTNFQELIEDPIPVKNVIKSNAVSSTIVPEQMDLVRASAKSSNNALEKIDLASVIDKSSNNTLEQIDLASLSGGEKYIPNTQFLDKKVIVLLLEVSLIDQKKCSETNCDDKGKRLEFNLRPILIDSSKIDRSPFLNTSLQNKFELLYLKRFNVPQITLINGQQVLNSFDYLINKTGIIDQIDIKFKNLYSTFQDSYFTSISQFSLLNNAKYKINEVVTAHKNKLHIQYVWDWLNDLVSAYNELLDFNDSCSLSFCCASKYESSFPFHVFLGKIETKGLKFMEETVVSKEFLSLARFAQTDYNTISEDQNYITPWLKVSTKEKKNEKIILKSLLERLVLLLNNFSVLKTDQETYFDSLVKITPSYLGDYPLSKKSIPYYYNSIPALSKVWNPKVTLKNNTNKILSYHASQYSTLNSTVYPLNYDLEPYNFYRIEGIIGKPYKQVLQSLLTIRKSSQLPFNIIAVNAVNLDAVTSNITNFLGDWGGTELNYDLIRRDWENVIGKSIEWLEANANLVSPYFDGKQMPIKREAQQLIKQVSIQNVSYSQFINLLKSGRNLMVDSFSDFIKIYTSFISVYERIEAIATQKRMQIFDGLAKNENPIFAEDLIDHLDTIVMVCQKGEFRALYEAAQEQWKKTSKELTLSNFIEKHPGMEHKDGVPVGGTLVLLYQDFNINPKTQTPIRKQPNTIEGTATSKSAKMANITPASELASVALNADAFSVSLQDYKNKIQAYASYFLPKESFTQLIEYMDNVNPSYATRDDLYKIPDQAVFADFYLPYICCSEGGSINFVLGNDTASGPADFENPDFSSTDFFTNKPKV